MVSQLCKHCACMCMRVGASCMHPKPAIAPPVRADGKDPSDEKRKTHCDCDLRCNSSAHGEARNTAHEGAASEGEHHEG